VKKPAAAAGHAHDHRHCVEDALAAAEKLCAAKSLRFTPLRRRVLELIWSGHKPVGAYALLDSLRSEELGSAPPTIYRALDFLIEHGLIHRIERMNAFIGCNHPGEAHRGFFLICAECGNAEELEASDLGDAITAGAARRGFTAREMTLEVTGVCADCSRQAA
jgi:Fur family transcriptional regulator, zinc uptake regulator